MNAARKDITGDDLARLEAARQAGREAFDQFIEAGPDDDERLHQIAWFTASFGEIQYPFHPRLRELINEARNERLTWREIAIALGEGTTEADLRRVREKQEWRNATFEQFNQGDTDSTGD